MTFGLSAGTIALIGAGATVASGMMAADAAGDAADTQAGAARDNSAAQERISDKQLAFQREALDRQLELQRPFRDIGLGAQSQLATLLGIPAGYEPSASDIAAIRSRLAPSYRTTTPVLSPDSSGVYSAPSSGGMPEPGTPAYFAALSAVPEGYPYPPETWSGFAAAGGMPGASASAAPTATEDTAGLDAALAAEVQKIRDANRAKAMADPAFGSLMKDYDKPAPVIGDFSMKDYQADPGLEFRRQQGEQALTRAAQAGGLLGSGKYLKDAMDFNSGLASQEYGNAFNRFQTNRANKMGDYANEFNRFQINRSNKLNPLQSLAGVGQTATAAMGNANANYANQATNVLGNYGSALGQNILGAGNAMAAGRVGGANAWNSAIGQGLSLYQQQDYLNRRFPQTPPSAPAFAGGGSFTYEPTDQPWYAYSGTGF